MSLPRLMNQPLTVQSVGPTTTDAYGNAVPGALGAPVATTGFLIQESSTEYLISRDTTITRWKAYLPAGTVIGPLDYITYQGQTFQVDGEPFHAWNPRLRAAAFIECRLTVVT